jgi:hypothetical protein
MRLYSLKTAGLVDENGKTMQTAPGQYTPNSRIESLARENYRSARVSALNLVCCDMRLMLDAQEAAQNAKKLHDIDNAFAGEQMMGRKMKAQFHSSRWSRTKTTE